MKSLFIEASSYQQIFRFDLRNFYWVENESEGIPSLKRFDLLRRINFIDFLAASRNHPGESDKNSGALKYSAKQVDDVFCGVSCETSRKNFAGIKSAERCSRFLLLDSRRSDY